jgi:predicted anti-sigma-YlaC factor YlaD
MTCLRDNNQGAELLIGQLEGTLSEADRQMLDAHAAECAECRNLLAVQATLDLPVPEVSSNFDARLYARIAADEARKPWWKMWTPIVAVAAMLAVTVYVQRPAPVSVDPELQQLEQALEDLELLMPATEAL